MWAEAKLKDTFMYYTNRKYTVRAKAMNLVEPALGPPLQSCMNQRARINVILFFINERENN